jgi:tetratricopeptide (TPR) repeat protein
VRQGGDFDFQSLDLEVQNVGFHVNPEQIPKKLIVDMRETTRYTSPYFEVLVSSPAQSPSGNISRKHYVNRLGSIIVAVATRLRAAVVKIFFLVSSPFRWWWQKFDAEPSGTLVLIATVFVLMLVAGAAISAATFLAWRAPVPLLSLSSFEMPEQNPLHLSGNNLAHLVERDLHTIIEESNYSGNPFAKSLYGPIPDAPHIPVQTNFGIQIHDVSVDQVLAVWDYFRYRELKVSGDLLVSSDQSMKLMLQAVGREKTQSWEEPLANASLPEVELAVKRLVADFLEDINPEVLGRYYSAESERCATTDCTRQNNNLAFDAFRVWAVREPMRAEPFMWMGRTLIHLDRKEEADLFVSRALELRPHYPAALNLRAETESDPRQRFEAAKQAYKFDKSITYDMGVGASYQNEMHDPLKAITYYEDTLRRDADYPGAWSNLGKAQMQLQRFDDAAKSFRKALELRPGFRAVLEALSSSDFLKSSHGQEAIETLKFETLLQPDRWEPSCYLGVAYFQQNSLDEAIPLLLTAANMAPDQFVPSSYLGAAYLKEGDPQKAIPYLTVAARVDPHSWSARYNLGLAYLRENDPATAAVYLIKASTLTSDEKVQEMLRQALSEEESKKAPDRNEVRTPRRGVRQLSSER